MWRSSRCCSPRCRPRSVWPWSSCTSRGSTTRCTRCCARATWPSVSPTPTRPRQSWCRRRGGATSACAARSTRRERSPSGARASRRSRGRRRSSFSSTRTRGRARNSRGSFWESDDRANLPRRMGIFRSVTVFTLLFVLKSLSKIFYTHDFAFIGPTPRDPWKSIRLVAFLNHTSLFEPVFLGAVPNRFIWRLAAHGVVPAADKTTDRPLVGLIFRFVAHHVIAITRQRDDTWFQVLRKIDPDSMVVLAPAGRMKRETGLDLHGNPMTVRGGIADILHAVKDGRFLIAYSGGLHHVQIPGKVPRLFKTVRLRVENVDIAGYINAMMARGGAEQFKRNVIKDLEERRDQYCPEERPAKVA